MNNLREYITDFKELPGVVKYAIYFVVVILVLAVLHQGLSNFDGQKKIEKLEKRNAQLEKTAIEAQAKAKSAEESAAQNAQRASELEKQLKPLEKKIKKSDEKISKQSQKSNNYRIKLNRVRRSRPANISTERLEKRLRERYGN